MRNMRIIAAFTTGCLGLALAFAPAQAAAAPGPQVCAAAFDQTALDKALDDLAAVSSGDFKAWQEKRAVVIGFGAAAVASLEAAAVEWTPDGHRRALAAEICRLRIAKPELASSVDKPRGIDPETYRQFRHGRPACHRDFAHAGKEIVPLLVEALTFTSDGYRFSEGQAGKLEREALLAALIQAPGEAADVRARFAMESAMVDAGLADNLRAFAAVSLAQCAGSKALVKLVATFDGETEPLALREGAGLALGWIAEKTALDAIKVRLEGESTRADGEQATRLRCALFAALGNLGGSWAWQSRGAEQLELSLEIRKGCAELLVAGLRSFCGDKDVIRDALCLVAWRDSLKTVKALSEDNTATQAARDAAKAIMPLLEMAVAREK